MNAAHIKHEEQMARLLRGQAGARRTTCKGIAVIYTTLNRIREHSPCAAGWSKLLTHLGKTKADDEPVSYVTILDSNGLGDALWCGRAEPAQHRVWRLFAVHCAESVAHLLTDDRSRNAIAVAKRHADGLATNGELAAAGDAAGDAAWDAAGNAAGDAAGAVAWAAAWAAAGAAAWAADGDAARDAARAEMALVFRNMVTTAEMVQS